MQKSDSALLVRMPYYIDGFSGPLAIDLVMTGSGKAVSVPLSIKPSYGTAY